LEDVNVPDDEKEAVLCPMATKDWKIEMCRRVEECNRRVQ
jgi:hypothetical protein